MAPTNITCPTCGAAPGHPCTDLLWKYPISGYHPTRKG